MVIKSVGSHEHTPSVKECESVAILHSMKSRARLTQETTIEILQSCVSSVSEDVLASLPTNHNIKCTIREQRA